MCFFQAEDGIRYIGVTGVQTCALPISNGQNVGRVEQVTGVVVDAVFDERLPEIYSAVEIEMDSGDGDGEKRVLVDRKSVVKGKSVDLGGHRIIKKKHNINTTREAVENH